MTDTPAHQRIVITGFMCAGKTTVAAALADLLLCSSLDLDAFIAEREGRTPHELIDEEGEAAFRTAETRALVEVLERRRADVIALGGGAWCVARNRAAISAHRCLTVWLDAPFELCWRRIQNAQSARPLGRERESARMLYEERLSSYRLAALHVRVDEGRGAGEIAAQIAAALGIT